MARQRGAAAEGDVEVLLVDDDAPTTGPVRAGSAADGAPSAPSPHRRRRAVAVAVAALVLVGGVNAAQAWRDHVATAAFAGVPGFVPGLAEEPEALWSLPVARLVDASDGVVLVADRDGSASAVDAVTGATLWRGPQDDTPGWSDCRFVRDAAQVEVPLRPWAFSASAADAVVCARRSTSGAATTSVLQVLDARSGAVRAERTVPGDAVVLDSVEGDVIHGERDAAGRVRVTRWDPESDTDVWSHREGAGGGGAGVLLAGDRVFLLRDDGAAVRSVVDGAEVARRGPAETVPVAALADGATLRVALDDRQGFGFVVAEADGSVRFRLGGWFAGPRALDPSAPAVLAHDEGGNLRALDVRDGRELWSREPAPDAASSSWWGPQDTPLAQVGHRLVLVGADGRLEAVDARDGSTLWRVEDRLAMALDVVSDGRVVLVPARADAGSEAEPVLLALDVRDGSEVWSVPLDEPAVAVQGIDGLLVVQGANGISAFRP